MNDVTVVRCTAIKANGEQCRVRTNINADNGRCLFHDPNRESALKAASARGSKQRKSRMQKPKSLASIEDCQRLREFVAQELLAERMKGPEADRLLKTADAQEKSFSGGLSDQLAEIQETLKAMKRDK